MKTGILTFSRANNYGAALQAFSLQKKTEEMGLQSELIDYRCPAIEAMRDGTSGGSLKARVYGRLFSVLFARRARAFAAFRADMRFSPPYTPETIAGANDRYDLFLTGSDQVFNLDLTGGDKAYFLDFVSPDKKKAAFAASLGRFLPERRGDYRRLLSTFGAVSLRERSSAEEIRAETGIDCRVVPDPVFLHTAAQWRSLLGIPERKETEPYLFLYALLDDPALYRAAAAVKARTGLRVIAFAKSVRPKGKADRFLRDPGPREFVSLLANADYVVTNSFHGTAFSVIFEKQFTTLVPRLAPGRITDLLEATGLSDRMVRSPEEIPAEAVDYAGKRAAIEAFAAQGEAFLRELCAMCQEKGDPCDVAEI